MGRCRLIRIMGSGVSSVLYAAYAASGEQLCYSFHGAGDYCRYQRFFATVYPPIICGGLSII